jgi:Zn-dependent peptidase ImmA (M78 family)
MPAPSPTILIWARETAGLSIEKAAGQLGLTARRGLTPAERLARIEAGMEEFGRPLLLKMARVYRRPLLVFYLDKPPEKGDRGEDFRHALDKRPELEPLVDALVRDIRARQSMVRAILEEEEEEPQPLPFIGASKQSAGVKALVNDISNVLGIDGRTYSRQSSPEASFRLLRNAAEKVGVFVILAGNLGSHHTALDTTAFRGFALADPVAPFIVINDQDSKPAWSFTLLHEFAHLCLGRSGISGAHPEGQLERFCNDVASQFLLSDDELALIDVNQHTESAQAAASISNFAEAHRLSRTLVAYRLFRVGAVDEQTWITLSRRFREERRQSRDRDGSEGGSGYYVVRRHKLGQALLSLVSRSIGAGLLTPTKASKVLGVRPRSVMPLLSGSLADRAA